MYSGDAFTPIATGVPHDIRWAAWTHDGQRAVLVGNRGTILDFDDSKFTPVATQTKENLRGVACNSGTNEALVVGNRGTVLLYSANQLRPLTASVEANLRRLAWNGDGSYALIIGNFRTCLRYADGEFRVVHGAENHLRGIAWHPASKGALIVGNRYRPSSAGLIPAASVYEYDDGNDRLTPLFTAEKADFIGVDWRPNGENAVIVGHDLIWNTAAIYQWDGREMTPLEFPGTSAMPTGVSWRPDGRFAFIVTGGSRTGVGEGMVFSFDGTRFERRFAYSTYHFIGTAWKPDSSQAFITGSPRSKTFTT